MPEIPGSAEPLEGLVANPAAFFQLLMPVTGDEWDDEADHGVAGYAALSNVEPEVAGDKDEDKDVITLAKAVAYRRLENEPTFATYPAEIEAAISHIMANGLNPGTESSPALALARNITPFVLAADILSLKDTNPILNDAFKAWLAGPVRTTKFGGRTLIQVHEKRPNNWGTHAGAARIAIARYIGDEGDYAQAVQVFKGWLGDRNAYAGFDWGDLLWQADEDQPVGINPLGAEREDKDGALQDIDGVLPDDQRRADNGSNGTSHFGFTWPPAKTNYVYEALQGVLLQAIMVGRAGRLGWGGPFWDPWAASDEAILRAFQWLADPLRGNFPVDDAETGSGDDYWQTHIINAVYATDPLFEAPVPTHIGKSFGFADWFATGAGWPGAAISEE